MSEEGIEERLWNCGVEVDGFGVEVVVEADYALAGFLNLNMQDCFRDCSTQGWDDLRDIGGFQGQDDEILQGRNGSLRAGYGAPAFLWGEML